MTFDPTLLMNKTAGMDAMNTLSYIGQHTYLMPILLLALSPLITMAFIGAIFNKVSIIKKGFWLMFFPVVFLEVLIAVFIMVYPIIPFYTAFP
jgi:hypothetical protein